MLISKVIREQLIPHVEFDEKIDFVVNLTKEAMGASRLRIVYPKKETQEETMSWRFIHVFHICFTDACVLPTINTLRKEMESQEHKPDAEFDKEVKFDTNYIHLILVNGSSGGNTDDKFSIEDILPEEEIMDFTGSRKNCIILKGRAGVGKTTLLQYLCRQWAKGNWGQQFAVIFLLKMRVIMTIKEKLTLTELLTNYSQFSSGKKMLSSWIPSNLDRIGIIIGKL